MTRESFSFALERDAVGVRGRYRLGCDDRLEIVFRDKTHWLVAQMSLAAKRWTSFLACHILCHCRRPRIDKRGSQVDGILIKLISIPGRTVIAVILVVLSAMHASSYGPFTLQDFHTRAAFELIVSDAKPLTPGTCKIVTQSAYVMLAHGLAPGNSDGLEIQFFPQPITEKVKADMLENDAKELKKNNYAAFLLYIGKDNKIWQANLSYVVPGTTVARTVAWKSEELQKYFSDYRFEGKRLALNSKGSYSESEKGREKLRLSWDVDLNLPVIREVKR